MEIAWAGLTRLEGSNPSLSAPAVMAASGGVIGASPCRALSKPLFLASLALTAGVSGSPDRNWRRHEQEGEGGELGDGVGGGEAGEVAGVEEEVDAGGEEPGDGDGADQGAVEGPGGPGEEDGEAEIEAADVGDEVLVVRGSSSTQWARKGKSS